MNSCLLVLLPLPGFLTDFFLFEAKQTENHLKIPMENQSACCSPFRALTTKWTDGQPTKEYINRYSKHIIDGKENKVILKTLKVF